MRQTQLKKNNNKNKNKTKWNRCSCCYFGILHSTPASSSSCSYPVAGTALCVVDTIGINRFDSLNVGSVAKKTLTWPLPPPLFAADKRRPLLIRTFPAAANLCELLLMAAIAADLNFSATSGLRDSVGQATLTLSLSRRNDEVLRREIPLNHSEFEWLSQIDYC